MKTLKRLLGPLRKPLSDLRKRYINRNRLADWRRVLRATGDLKVFRGDPDGPRIVHMAMIGHMYLTNFEVPFELAMNVRGARAEMVFDDRVMPLCELTDAATVAKGQGDYCRQCVRNMRAITGPAPVTVRLVSEFVTPDLLKAFTDAAAEVDVSDIIHYAPDGIPIGKAAFMVTLRHFRKGWLDQTEAEARVLRQYLVSAMVSRHVAQSLADEGPIHAAVMSHGIYSSWEPALEVFKQRGIRVACFERQVRQGYYEFNWDVSPQTHDITAPWERRWKDRPLTEEQITIARDYLASRETFEQEACKYSDSLPEDPAQLRASLGIAPEKTALLLVSNLVWDAAAAGRDLIFKNTLEWVTQTVEMVAGRPDLHLIVKPHPAEMMRDTQFYVGQEIRKLYPELPENVTVLRADEKMNPMSLMKGIDVGISHTSTAGMEMAGLGKPVIPVSMAHYRAKGFTFDPENLEEYRDLVEHADTLPQRYTAEMRALALKYIYVRFFKYQHCIPLTREPAYLLCTGYNMKSLDDLRPGHDAGLDFICDAILHYRQDFVQD